MLDLFGMKEIWSRKLLRSSSLPPAVAVVLLGLCFGYFAPGFLTVGNALSVGQQTSVIAIGAFSMTALIITRGIDLSIGANLALSGMALSWALEHSGSPIVAVLVCCGCGIGLGLINGFLVGFVRISPFMATLATMTFARGAALLVSGASSTQITDPALLWAGSGTVFGIPASLVLALAVMVAWIVLMKLTVFGRWIYAVGGNETAASYSLIPVRFVHLANYGLSGLSASLGAIITIGRLGSAQPLAGLGLEFACITAAMVGGTSLMGGKGAIFPTAVGALLLGVIAAGLSFLQVPQQVSYIITGCLLLASTLFALQRPSFGLSRGNKTDISNTSLSDARRGDRNELLLNKLTKSYGAFQALKNGTFSIKSGQIVGLMGENGAGKSTLVKCLTGVQDYDGGGISLNGSSIEVRSTADARSLGVTAIHQHFSLIPDLSIAENLFMLDGPRRFGLLNRAKMRVATKNALNKLGLHLDPDTKVEDLTVGQRQLVEIAKSMEAGAWLIIMDEPTSALSVRERDRLYDLVRTLAKAGCAVLYISHKLEEIFDLCSDVVVLRDGATVSAGPIADYTASNLVTAMVGREVSNVFPHAEIPQGNVVLSVENLSDGEVVKEASLTLRAGETVAISGLMGSGRTELLRCLAGLSTRTVGTVIVNGSAMSADDAEAAYAAGIVYVPEDRHSHGFVGSMTVEENLSLVWMRQRGPFLSLSNIRKKAKELIDNLGIRPPDPTIEVQNLSGGNQQKVVIGKWLADQPRIILLDEPTNGVDVGAKSEIHHLVLEMKKRGAAILMVSSELPEVLGVADRIVVMANGRTVGELERGASETEVMALAFSQTMRSHEEETVSTPQGSHTGVQQ